MYMCMFHVKILVYRLYARNPIVALRSYESRSFPFTFKEQVYTKAYISKLII